MQSWRVRNFFKKHDNNRPFFKDRSWKCLVTYWCALRGLFLCFQLADSCGVQEPCDGSFGHPRLSSGRLDVPRGSFQPSSSHELTGRLQPGTLQLQSRELHPAHPTQTLQRCPHLTNTLHPIRPNLYQLATEIISVTIQYGMKRHRGERCHNRSHEMLKLDS